MAAIAPHGNYTLGHFSSLEPVLDALQQTRITPIWDLCHYGYPDDLDPFSDTFIDRFAQYCRAAAEYVIPQLPAPHFFTPINEITFFSFCGGEWGWVAPYKNTREDRFRFRLALCRAAIAGVNAIREVAPDARMIHIDPLIQVVAPCDRPDQIEAARQETYEDTFLAWDSILSLAVTSVWSVQSTLQTLCNQEKRDATRPFSLGYKVLLMLAFR